MKTPNLNRRLQLEVPTRVADGAGGFQLTWTARGSLWAAVKPGSGREAPTVEAREAQVSYQITVRGAPVGSDARPKPEDRLREATRVFTVLAVTEADSRGQYLTCFAREEVPA
jgi:head-tail adaptor